MKQKDSAIMQMFFGKRGNFELINFSEEYNRALGLVAVKTEEFKNALEKCPELLGLFDELEDARANENTIYTEDVYAEAFSFGLALGQEVFGK